MVNAPVIAKERRHQRVSRDRRDQGIYEGYIKLVVEMSDGTTSRVAGTSSPTAARLIQYQGYRLDAEFAPHMLYVGQRDKPGLSAKLGTLLGTPGQYRQHSTWPSAPARSHRLDRGGRRGSGSRGAGRRKCRK